MGPAMEDYQDGLIETRNADRNLQHWRNEYFTFAQIEEAAEWLAKANDQQRNVFFGLNPRKPETDRSRMATENDIEASGTHFADVDDIRTLKPLTLAPNFSTTTGNVPSKRGHFYWTPDETIRNTEHWSVQQKAIAFKLGSDPSVIDKPRIAQVAGVTKYQPDRKRARGYVDEFVRLKVNEDRDRVSSQAIWHHYPYENPTRLNLAINDHRDDGEYLARVRAGDNWNTNAFILVARMILRGNSDEQILREAEGWTLAGYTTADTRREIGSMIRRTREKQARGEFGASAVAERHEEPLADIELRPLGILKPRERKPREFIIKGRLMREHITLTSAPPGVGKTLHALEEAVSLGSGVDFLGVGVDCQYRVGVINNEETRDEIERRIEATCIHFGIAFDEIANSIFVHSGVDAGKFVVARDVGGSVVYTPHQERVKALINELKLDVLILDPFVQTHFVSENANEAISRVMVGMREMLTGEHKCALNLIHHIRKPQPGSTHIAGDMFASRGSGSMVGEAHFVFTLADMTSKEADQLGVGDDDRGWFVRLDDAKAKLSAPSSAQWFEREGVEIPRTIGAEEVGVLVPWTPPEDPLHVSVAVANEILQVIQSRWTNGNPLSKQGDRALVRWIIKEKGLTRNSAKNLVRQWVDNEVLGYGVADKKQKTAGYRVLKWPGRA